MGIVPGFGEVFSVFYYCRKPVKKTSVRICLLCVAIGIAIVCIVFSGKSPDAPAIADPSAVGQEIAQDPPKASGTDDTANL